MRLARRLLVLLLALAVIAGAVLLAIEVVRAALDQPYLVVPWQEPAANARTLTWTAVDVRVVAGVLLGVGTVLVLLALWPRRSDWLRAASGLDRVEVAVDRHGLRQALERAALEVDGVRQASVRVRKRRVRVRAVGRPGAKPVRDEVTQTVTGRLQEFSLTPEPRVRTRFRAVAGER